MMMIDVLPTRRTACVCCCLLLLGVACRRGSDRATSIPPASAITSTELAIGRSNAAEDTLFVELDAESTGLDFQMQLYDPVEHVRVLMFITACGGICTGDYDGDGLPDIYVTSPVGGNRLFRNLGELRFQDVTHDVGLHSPKFWGTGATFVDIDNDGDLDIYACGYDRPNQLWINDDGRFTEQAERFGLDYHGASMTMAFADIDNDGDLDGYLATTALTPPPGTKFGVVFEGDKPVIPEPLKEYWELLYLPGDRAHRTEAGQYDHLFLNDNGRFRDISKQAGIDGPHFTLAATWWDYNQDGFPDLYASNDYMGPDKLYHNNGDGTFTNVIEQVAPHTPWFSMGSDIGDINNDGLLDFFATDMSATNHYRDKVMMGNMDDTGWFLEFAQPRQYMRNAVYLNSGVGRAFEVAFQCRLSSSDWTWTPRLADFDNDGYVDVFATNGILRDSMNSDLSNSASQKFKGGSQAWAEFWSKQPMHREPNHAFRNLGDLKFEEVSSKWGLDRTGVSFGAATADFDNDGDLDLVVNNADTKMSLFENRSSGGNRLRVQLHGTQSNRYGVGATVTVEAGGQKHVRYLTLARGWLSAGEPELHFGLGSSVTIEKLTVQWPSGHMQEFRNLSVDRRYTITEPSESPSQRRFAIKPQQPLASGAAFHVADQFSGARHKEVPFDDFQLQPLLPNRQSQFGPALAVADVDGDGDQDVYLGGSADIAGQLLLNDRQSFQTRSIADFAKDASHEDVDAVFLDVDNDGDADLFVASGSNQWPTGSSNYQDRLYLNDGAGQFRRADLLPRSTESSSCVAATDYDADGDIDLFVGGRGIPGAYPRACPSRLLKNESGKFSDASPEFMSKLGIVTDAIWHDLNEDQRPDLVLTTEWGPVRVIHNLPGNRLVDETESHRLNRLLGWWNSVDAGDINRDGHVDLVVTNFGHNTKYKASAEKPELLYFGDLDGTGKPHIVEAKFEGERCLPRRGFSCSQNAMPFLRPKLETFHNFASATLEEIYTPQRLENCERYEANELAHGWLKNDGRGGFDFVALPPIAQVAPSMSAKLLDYNGDQQLDLVLAQNFYSTQRETGHMDGGLSLLLAGDGRGNFRPVWPRQSGIYLTGDTRRVEVIDVNQDGQRDLIFGVNDGPLTVLLHE